MKPKPFQEKTTEAAVIMLTRRQGSRRFLVADEVGLGKTVVAHGVVRRLSNEGTKPLRVFYVAPGHAIAHQNHGSLLIGKDGAVRQDRLGLLPYVAATRPNVHVYALSPGTSFQTRGTGQKAERLRIQLLLEMAYPNLDLPRDLFTHGVHSWDDYYREQRNTHFPTHRIMRRFKFYLHEELAVTPHNVRTALQILAKKRHEFFSRLRSVLATVLLESHRPSLLVLDEFQRYLLSRRLERRGKDVLLNKLLDPKRRSERPAVLLLSATPFKLLPEDDGHEDRSSIYQSFYDLLEFLAQGEEPDIASLAKQRFAAFRKALTAFVEASDTEADQHWKAAESVKNALESMLKRFMSRTERTQFQRLEPGLASEDETPIELDKQDVAVFKHLANGFRRAREQVSAKLTCCHVSDAVTYWRSVPLPAQGLGPSYQAWRKSKHVLLGAEAPERLTEANKTRGGARGSAKLRRLQELCPKEMLSLPWCSPSVSWWELGGRWRELKCDSGQKVLLFSRFRATPGAVSALMTLTSEGTRRESRMLSPSGPTYAAFYPSPMLIERVDTLLSAGSTLRTVRARAEKQLRELLSALGVRVENHIRKGKRRRRGSWELLWALERQYDRTFGSTRCHDLQLAWRSVTGGKAPPGDTVHSVRRREVLDLAALAVEAPGIVCGRAFHRYKIATVPAEEMMKLSWEGLRTYLDDPTFLWSGRKRTPVQQVRDLVSHGCLEAVLDEHIWYSMSRPSATLKGVAEELREALQLPAGAFSFQRGRGAKPLRIACRAAVPFGGSERFLVEKDAVRPDAVRKAFNSPFRPFLLASTSVGQEGLDFHVWCDRIVHWDLCSTPLDLEQREGRIQRYLNLGVRRAMARAYSSIWVAQECPGRPWDSIQEQAENASDGSSSGMTPWWTLPGATIHKHVFLLQQSRDIARYSLLRKQRMLYRFALGQPDAREFVSNLTLAVSSNPERQEEVIKLTLDLRPTQTVAP